MSKQIRKTIISFVLMLVVILGGLIGCTAKNGGLLNEYSSRPNKVRVLYNNAGYGYQWLMDVSKYYMDNVDTETYIDIKNTPMDAEEGIKLASGIQTHDVYLLGYLYDYSTAENYLLDLSDIYNGKSTGEETYVKDKISNDIKEFYYPKNTSKIYYLPYMGKTGYSFCYNTTTLDSALGKGNYTLPRTTDELFEFGDALKAKGVFLTAGAYGDATDYFSAEPWLCQAMGVENYFQARKGYYYDGSKYVFSNDYPYIISTYQDAYEDIYEVTKKLGKKSNNYIHRDSNAMEFLDVEKVLAGLSFGTTKNKIAYHYNGSYLLNEMEEYLNIMANDGKPQTIRAEKLPIISSVIRQTPSITSDAVLRTVVDYVDGKTNVKPTNVDDSDIEIIREARNVIGAHMLGSIAIGKKAQNVEGCMNFVRFLTTSIAQKISSEALEGLEMLPYGYSSMTSEESDIPFINDIRRINKNSIIVPANIGINETFLKYGEFDMLPYSQAGLEGFANESGLITKTEYYQKTLNYYASNNCSRWKTIINNYNKAMGI